MRSTKTQFTKKSPMKTQLILTFATFAAATSAASAANIIFSFGVGDPTPTQTINRVATSNSSGTDAQVTVADALDTTGASTGISTSASGAQWFSQGGAGSFAPVGGVTYDNSNPLVNSWNTTYGPSNVGNIWQQGANGDSPTGGPNVTSTLAFAGLAANTSYTFTLLSVRANGFLTDSGAYALEYDNVGLAPALTGAGTVVGNVVTGAATGNASGLNAREISWSFTTGATPGAAALKLTGDWNLNAIIIVPEPSTALLGGFGALLVLRRRRA